MSLDSLGERTGFCVQLPCSAAQAPVSYVEDPVMVRSNDDLETQLLGLPPSDRARLAEVLLASLDEEHGMEPVDDVEAAWRAESERRLTELRQGLVAGIPADQVFAAACARIRR